MLNNTGSALEEAGRIMLRALSQYVDESQSGSGPVVTLEPLSSISKELQLDRYIREGGLDLQGLQTFLQSYLRHSMHMHHPAYIGHQVAVPHFASALSDLLHGIIGNPMSIYEMGPPAAAAEQSVSYATWKMRLLVRSIHFRSLEGSNCLLSFCLSVCLRVLRWCSLQ